MLDNKNDFSCVRVIVGPRHSSIFLLFFFRFILFFEHLFKMKIAEENFLDLWIDSYIEKNVETEEWKIF